MENVSPVKFGPGKKKLILLSYVCLICGKQAKKGALKNPKEQGLGSFIDALVIRGHCNGYPISEFKEYIDITSKTWTNNESDVH